MGLYRLLGNKADVIKGFAKRCNEQWEVAPRSEIGLYLGDIQGKLPFIQYKTTLEIRATLMDYLRRSHRHNGGKFESL